MKSSATQLTLCAADFRERASPTALPASNVATTMTAQSGRTLIGLSALLGPVSSSLRMCLESSAWRSMVGSLTWTHSTTKVGQSLYRLRLSVPRTGETGCGLSVNWPTPRVSAERNSRASLTAKHWSAPSLMQAVELASGILPREYETFEELPPVAQRMWTTPQHHDHHGGAAKRVGRYGTKHGGRNLAVDVMLPTPRHEGFDAGSHRGSPDSLHALVKTQTKDGLLTTPTADDTGTRRAPYRQGGTALSAQVAATGMKLNPDWVCRMMGFPDSWMNVGEATP